MFNLVYLVQGIHYKTKLDALYAAKGDATKIKGSIFNDRLLFSYPWKMEPPESFKELCRQRAQQLRDNHKHITLLFGGGVDCYTVLKTFYENNILLDKVLVNLPTFFNDSWNDPSNIEYQFVAKPLMNRFEKLMPKTEFDYHIDTQNRNYIFDFESMFQKSGLHPFVRHRFSDFFSNDNKTTYLVGDLDPDVSYRKGKFYIEIWDSANVELFKDLNAISFFTDPNFPQLHAKQCHIIKNYFSSLDNPESINDFKTKRKAKIELLRDVDPLIIAYDKGKPQFAPSHLGYKHELLYKNLPDEEQNRLLDLFSYKIFGKPIYQLKLGVKLFEVEI